MRALNILLLQRRLRVSEHPVHYIPPPTTSEHPPLRAANCQLDRRRVSYHFLVCVSDTQTCGSSPPPPLPIATASSLAGRALSPLLRDLSLHASAIRTLSLQMHTPVSQADPTANHELFLDSIERLRDQCRSLFSRLDRLTFLVCRNRCGKLTFLSRFTVNVVAEFVLGTYLDLHGQL